jgi:hypothetical protein
MCRRNRGFPTALRTEGNLSGVERLQKDMGSSINGVTRPATFAGLVMPQKLEIDRVRCSGVRVVGRT